MKKNLVRILSLALCAVLLCGLIPMTASADRVFLIADSNTRKLTRDELWTWDYESLGYILNEIFARHGYVFEAGGKYEYYFSCMPWYTPNSDSNNSRACYSQMNDTEWYNENLVKEVRQEMRNLNTQNKTGHSVWEYFTTGFDTLQGFEIVTALKPNQKLEVYSAPSTSSWRGANGKALVNTNGALYAAGWESGWMLVMYETNNGSVRVGYVNSSKISGPAPTLPQLRFEYSPATVIGQRVALTDDPAKCYDPITYLSSGASVTYLTTYFNRSAWDYVETTVNGQTVRGFILSGNLNILQTQDSIGAGY